MDTTFDEFPFVATMPKRKKSALRSAWDSLEEFRRLTAEHGGLVPPLAAAALLGVSKQRVCTLMNEGKLAVVAYGNLRYVAADSLEAWAKSARKVGRPKESVD